jgi:hypothetical protein
MALSVIIILYVFIGFMSAAGTMFISKKIFSSTVEQKFFAFWLILIAGFYLAFTAYFGSEEAWRFEIGGVIAFSVLGLLGVRVPAALIIGYLIHGLWDVLHEVHSHSASNLFSIQQLTEVPLGYGFFCATYDWCLAAYFYTRRGDWRTARVART